MFTTNNNNIISVSSCQLHVTIVHAGRLLERHKKHLLEEIHEQIYPISLFFSLFQVFTYYFTSIAVSNTSIDVVIN